MRFTTECVNRILRFLGLRDRFISSIAIANQWFEEHERLVPVRAVYHRIRSFDFFSYRPHLVLLFTAEHSRHRLEWCKERRN